MVKPVWSSFGFEKRDDVDTSGVWYILLAKSLYVACDRQSM